MSPYHVLFAATAVDILLGATLLALLIQSREFRTYWPLLYLAMWQALPFATLVFLRNYGPSHHLAARTAYAEYFYTYWISFACEAVASVVLTYTILHGAMAPLQGLQKLVKIMYFWAAGISLLVALNVSFAPSADSLQLVKLLVFEFQRATGIITVSLAIFVCLAIRPMGLSLRSRVFGTTLGLILVSGTNTLEVNYFSLRTKLDDLHSLFAIAFTCVAEIVWIYYFAVPEPKRQFVLLATTSPFHRWNLIAEQFGQDPGVVAIGGIPPDAFTSAELEVFHRTSAKIEETEAKREELNLPEPPTAK